MSQEELMGAVMGLSGAEISEMRGELLSVAPWARGKQASERAKLYAAIRFVQDGKDQAQSKQAWIQGVAKRAHRQMEQLKWSDGRSGSAGKSLSPGKSVNG